jgi:ankyrin repeat protein
MWAARNGHATVVELLLDAKADAALCDQVCVPY